MNSLEWQAHGKCATDRMDPDIFFPDKDDPLYRRKVSQAKFACARCPVQLTCLQWALDTHQTDGIYGSKTPEQRRSIRYPRRRINGKLTYIKETLES